MCVHYLILKDLYSIFCIQRGNSMNSVGHRAPLLPMVAPITISKRE